MYPTIYRSIRRLWPRGRQSHRYLRELERTQWLSKDELYALQLSKLQTLVKHAYENVSFYHEKYKAAGIHPKDIKSLEDFQALPFLTRQDVNDNLEALIANNFS